ncbi:MAG: LLM class flavin-dependent oxidoreductase [Gammaproteobacteria bacterium]|nr:LLM class flavin-dependent oxidoreductase [Gammaproteobacteria bacterium]
MKFGVCVATNINDWQLLVHAENQGFDHGWVPDSQMIWSDCYAVLALAAHHTSRIRLGTGVAIAGTRIAPVTAHSIASINRIAPGRVFLGIGTGHTAMRVMNFNPMKAPPFREYLRVVRALLDGDEVEFTLNGETRTIEIIHKELGFVDTEHRIPMYVAANGPLALRAAGEFGDGRVSGGSESADAFANSMARIGAGAARVGRSMDGFHTAELTYACILRPGETLASDRVIDTCGHMVASRLHGLWEAVQLRGEDIVPEDIRPVWEQYRDFVAGLNVPRERAGQVVHRGHCTYLLAEERRFVTPQMLRTTGALVGTPEEIMDMLRTKERNGLKEVILLQPMATARENLTDFRREIIDRF